MEAIDEKGDLLSGEGQVAALMFTYSLKWVSFDFYMKTTV